MSEMKEYIVVKLKEMGFDEAKIERAVNSTPCESLDQVMEWIITESERAQPSTPVTTGSESSPVQSSPSSGAPSSASSGSGSATLKLTPIPTETASEDTEASKNEKVKSPEEVEAEKRKLEEKIKQRRLQREEEERKAAIEREKKRRETGSEISKFREQYETKEKIRIAQEIRKEKLEREAHKKAVLEQIRKDREAMKRENQPTSLTPSTSGSTPSKVSNTGSGITSDANECKLAIRLPNGQTITQKFIPNEQLAAVRLFIQLNRKDLIGQDGATRGFKLHMPPNQVFTDDDMDKTLLELGLCPSARLIVSDLKRPSI